MFVSDFEVPRVWGDTKCRFLTGDMQDRCFHTSWFIMICEDIDENGELFDSEDDVEDENDDDKW